MKLKEILEKTIQFFKDKKLDSPRLDAELIIAHGLKIERIQLYLKFDQPLSEPEISTCRELVRRRAQGEPVAYILGTKDFFGYTFAVNSHTLIPRPETEHVVEAVLEWTENLEHPYTILDLGTGSGCIGLSLLKRLPQAQLIAVDLSEGALEVARKNAQALEIQDRVQFVFANSESVDQVLADLQNFTGREDIDILVSNPPYIAVDDKDVEDNVKKFEPSSALFAEDHGLQYLKSWSKKYAPFLASKAIMLMEMGMSQGDAMKAHFQSLQTFQTVDVIKDLAGLQRVIRGVKNG